MFLYCLHIELNFLRFLLNNHNFLKEFHFFPLDKEQIIFTNEPTIIVDGYVVNTIFEKFPLREIKIDDNNDWNYIKNYKFNK